MMGPCESCHKSKEGLPVLHKLFVGYSAWEKKVTPGIFYNFEKRSSYWKAQRTKQPYSYHPESTLVIILLAFFFF